VRALVVDDSRATRSIIQNLLRRCGFEVVEAGHGREGLDCLEAGGPFELAIVDWNMPRMNGLAFIGAVRRNSGWDPMRIIMVTTETEGSQVARALEAGANEYVMKPFTPDIPHEKLDLLGMSAA
jgi:two-component system, chemotaxis family, chemotaxis protein CheY